MSTVTATKTKTYDLAYIAIFAVLIAICSWISIPMTVPFTLQNRISFLRPGNVGYGISLGQKACYSDSFHGSRTDCLLRNGNYLVHGCIYKNLRSCRTWNRTGLVRNSIYHS